MERVDVGALVIAIAGAFGLFAALCAGIGAVLFVALSERRGAVTGGDGTALEGALDWGSEGDSGGDSGGGSDGDSGGGSDGGDGSSTD